MKKCPVCTADVSNVPLFDLLLKGCPECKSTIMTTEQFKKEQLLKDKNIVDSKQEASDRTRRTSNTDDYSNHFINERKAR